MKSSLKVMVIFELFEGMVGFEYTHSSFPERKRSPEYTIFFNLGAKSSFLTKNVALEGLIATLTFIHSSFPER